VPLPVWAIVSVEAVLAVLLSAVLLFFRDPDRHIEKDPDILLAPADGKITDIETTDYTDAVKRSDGLTVGRFDGRTGGAKNPDAVLRIGIFMSIFDTHINRAPCNSIVEKVTYKQGKYINAMDPKSSQINESNDLGLVRTDSPEDKLVVRQISGAIARRIVCATFPGEELATGQKFGMIKFGSRCELYVPIREDVKCLVKIGDKVKAGLTPLVKYEMRHE
jgi:phosphatidylserine decarboxylase